LHWWAQLAAKGNATALHFLFADATATSSGIWAMVQQELRLFLSAESAAEFLGFAENQRQRITGERGQGTKGHGPEYENAFGYDSKAAMHCLRLYLECIELMKFGTITLPRPERDFLVEVRSGGWTLERFHSEATRLRMEAERGGTIGTAKTGRTQTHFGIDCKGQLCRLGCVIAKGSACVRFPVWVVFG
jgi:hypothetical protein